MGLCWDVDQHHARDRIHPGSVVVDIGACVGEFAIPAAEAGAVVWCYDPRPENIAVLREAGLSAVPAAVGMAGDWYGTFVDNDPPSGGYVVPGNGPVRIVSLASVVLAAGGHVDVLKVDCEGAEYDIFHDADRETMRQIDYIAVEFHVWTTWHEPRREGIGHRSTGPRMPAHAPARLIDRLGLTHDVTMDGDLAAGGVIFAERSD